MRETCARVLAAALMTGAIAFAVGMPALFETAHDLGRSFLTPPSSLHRTVRAPASSEPRTTGAGRPGSNPSTASQGNARARSVRELIHAPNPQVRQRPGAVKPAPAGKPKPVTTPPAGPGVTTAPQVGTRELTSASPPSAGPPATARPVERVAQHPRPAKPKGKAKGHEKGNRAAPAADTAEPTTTAGAQNASPSSTCQPEQTAPAEQDDDKGHGHGQGQGRGSGNGNAAGESNGNAGHDNGNGQSKGHGG